MGIHEVKQDLFSRAYSGLRNQGFEQSMIATGTCGYLSKDGLKRCAVGHLLSSKEEAIFFDDIGAVRCIIRKSDEERGGDPRILERFFDAIGVPAQYRGSPVLGFLQELQEAHDNDGAPSLMRSSLGLTAQRHGLEVPA